MQWLTEQVRRMADDFARRLQSQGLTIEQYMQFTGMTADKLLEQMQSGSTEAHPEQPGT